MRSPLATAWPDAERQARGASCACAGGRSVLAKAREKRKNNAKRETPKQCQVQIALARLLAQCRLHVCCREVLFHPPATGTLQGARPKMFTVGFLTVLLERSLVRVVEQCPLFSLGSENQAPAWPHSRCCLHGSSSCPRNPPPEPVSRIILLPQPTSRTDLPPGPVCLQNWPVSRTCAPCTVASILDLS